MDKDRGIPITGNARMGLHTAIESVVNSKEPLAIKVNEQGIEIVNVNEVNRSPFAPEPMPIKNFYENRKEPFIDTPINPNQKKFRKHNNRKNNGRKKYKSSNRKHNKRRK